MSEAQLQKFSTGRDKGEMDELKVGSLLDLAEFIFHVLICRKWIRPPAYPAYVATLFQGCLRCARYDEVGEAASSIYSRDCCGQP